MLFPLIEKGPIFYPGNSRILCSLANTNQKP
jgi:hypothetical protein